MKQSKAILTTLVLLSLGVSGVIIYYFWTHSDYDSMKNIPVYVMLLALGYILIQIARRYITKQQNWWDWIYYGGLAAIMIPNFFIDENTVETYNLIADIGVVFLVVPNIFEVRVLMKRK